MSGPPPGAWLRRADAVPLADQDRGILKWRNRWAGEWDRILRERVPGSEDAGTGQEQGLKPGPVLRARRARESKRLRRERRWPRGARS